MTETGDIERPQSWMAPGFTDQVVTIYIARLDEVNIHRHRINITSGLEATK
jgi:hypothetical protein